MLPWGCLPGMSSQWVCAMGPAVFTGSRGQERQGGRLLCREAFVFPLPAEPAFQNLPGPPNAAEECPREMEGPSACSPGHSSAPASPASRGLALLISQVASNEAVGPVMDGRTVSRAGNAARGKGKVWGPKRR